MAKQTKGFCKYCGKEYARGGMLKHLTACKKRKERLEAQSGKTKCGYFELVISDKYQTAYWLIVEIKETATLRDLDLFIRDIWVECCGHLSGFECDGVRYESYPSMDSFWGPPAKSMNYKLKDIFTVGQTIAYEYDYGSTTDLLIKVHSYRSGVGRRDKITLLSRNNPPEILCSQCGENKAQWINSEEYYGEKPFWCEKCKKEKNVAGYDEEEFEEFEEYYSEEFFLPVCNSPRMGVCGYEGSDEYPDQFLPDEKDK